MVDKAEGAFWTISELAEDLGLPQHVLRYWETRFPQLRPLTRAGNRRYYRSEDVVLAQKINRLLNQEGYTVKGVQQLLRAKGAESAMTSSAALPSLSPSFPVHELIRIRDNLAAALRA